VTLFGTCTVLGAPSDEALLVRALINGSPMSPGDGKLCDTNSEFQEDAATAIRWVIQNRPAGSYTLSLQWKVDGNAEGFLSHWTMTVERYKDV
jgi:hypothetical protein